METKENQKQKTSAKANAEATSKTAHSKKAEAHTESIENTELENLHAELETLSTELEKQKDLLLRTAAEFDNYKKRTEREKTMTAEYAKAALIKTLLPVIDNANRAAEADCESPDYIKGAQLIIKQLLESVTTIGITETAQVGDTFNPELHEAVMHVEDENQPENCVVEVLQKGYKLNDTVLRPAMVKVAN